MYSIRVNNRFPQVYRVCRPAACVPTRAASLVPRFVGNDFSPVFRLMDDLTNHIAARPTFDLPTFTNNTRSFSPRFDVKETNEGYELVGELPGIDQEALSIEFTDAQTISIKGQTDTHRQKDSRLGAKAIDTQSEQSTTLPEAEQTSVEVESIASSASETSSYHRPTVEDEEATASGATANVAEPAQVQNPTESPEQQVSDVNPMQRPEESHYWVSERSVGQFQRSFAFPSRINQDGVHASLKDGILSIIVPKATLPANRRINIE